MLDAQARLVPEAAAPPGSSSTAVPPLAGVRVIELGRFAAGPSCATVLADWGAEVIKLEPLGGDPARGPGSLTGDRSPVPNPRFEVHNRSRRSVALDLHVPAGREVADRLLATADVLVTNLSPGAVIALGMDAPTLRARHPRLIVAQLSGYDLTSALAHDRSYDHGAYWSYSGAASMFAPAGGQPPQPAAGFGDRAAGSMLAGAVTAALFARERTGAGSHVTTSLVNTGLWLMASDVSDILNTGHVHRSTDRRQAPVPTLNCFRTADARWLWLQVMMPERDWPRLLAALDAPWLDEDPRFHGGAGAKLSTHRAALNELLDEVFCSRPLDEWGERLRAHGVTWAPVRTLEEAVLDKDVRHSPAVVEFTDELGLEHVSVNTPCRFDGATPRPASRAPEPGEHTDDVLTSIGVGPAEVADLRHAGVIGGRDHQPTDREPVAATGTSRTA